jgi:hypothetical protein
MAVLPAGGWLAGRKLRQRSGVTGPPPPPNTFITGPAESRWRASTGHDERPRRPARPCPNWPWAVRARQYQDMFGEG